MGIPLFGRVSACECSIPLVEKIKKYVRKKNTKPPNPDPKNYEILEKKQVGSYIILLVNYPDCVNFEGEKVLVFKNNFDDTGKLDPHFCEHSNLVARFIPTAEGIKMAFEFCEMMKRKDEE